MREALPPTSPSRRPRLRWISLAVLGLAATLLAGAAIFGLRIIWQPSGNASYSEAEIVYDQPMRGAYELGTDLTTMVYLPPESPQPQIDVPESFGNVGRIRKGSIQQHVFVVRNIGYAPLTVGHLYTTCEYLSADLTASTIPPNRAALLTITLDASQFDDARPRMVRRGAILRSNDPRRPEVGVWVQAVIVP